MKILTRNELGQNLLEKIKKLEQENERLKEEHFTLSQQVKSYEEVILNVSYCSFKQMNINLKGEKNQLNIENTKLQSSLQRYPVLLNFFNLED